MKDIESVRTAIKSSATELFSSIGYEKTTIEDIAARAGKAKTSIYYHYEGKRAILEAVVQEEFLCVKSSLQGVKDNDDERIVSRLIKYLEKRMELLSACKVYKKYFFVPYTNPSSELSQIIRSYRDEFDQWEKNYFIEVCQAGLEYEILSDSVNPNAFSEMLVMVLKGVEVQFFTTSDIETIKATYSGVVERLLAGMGINNNNN